MDIPTEPFNLNKLGDMCLAIKDEHDVHRCQGYIQDYFYHTFHGIFFYNIDSLQFNVIDEKNIRQYLPDGLVGRYLPASAPEKVKIWKARQWFQNHVFDRYQFVTKLNAPPIDFVKKTINMMGRLKFGDLDSSKYDDCSDQTKKAVEMMLSHLKEVWCSGNEEQYEYVLTWLSCLGRRKVKSALYLQSLEQTGKSLVVEFLKGHVFGKSIVSMTDDIESISKYTQSFEGKILVNINEMPCVSTGQFMQVMNKLKTLITDSTFIARAMYQQGRETENTFNLILTSNNDAIGVSTTNNKRYKMLDVSNARIGDHKYFNSLCKAAMNDSAGRAFFLWLKERYQQYGKYFNADKFPKTLAFKDKINEKLNPLYRFIKFKFIKKGKGLDMALPEIYSRFQKSTYAAESRQEKTKIKVSKELQQIRPIQYTRKDYTMSNGKVTKCYFYKASYKDLFDEFTKQGWIHEVDNIEYDDETDDDSDDETDDGSDETDDDPPLADSSSESAEPPPELDIAALDRAATAAPHKDDPLSVMFSLGVTNI